MERQEKCPKCGTDRPKPGDTFTTDWAGYSLCNKSISWIAEVKASQETKRRVCSCQYTTLILDSLRGRRGCETCGGKGHYDSTEVILPAPEHMRIHCDGCGYSWKEPPLDSKED